MKKLKVFIGFSAIISLFMCVLTLYNDFIFDENVIYNVKLLYEVVDNLLHIEYWTSFSIIFPSIFLLNSISLIFYLFKIEDGILLKKYFSFFNIILLFIGLLIFILYTISFLRFYTSNEYFLYFSYEFILSKWKPKLIIFSVPTLYLVIAQIYLIIKSKSKKFTAKFIISSIYASSLIFLTIMTFCSFSYWIDNILAFSWLDLKTIIPLFGSYDTVYANINYYIYYVIALTAFFGAIFGVSMLYSRRKSKKQIK